MMLIPNPAAPEVARDLAVVLSSLHGPTAATDIQGQVSAGIGSPATVYFSPRSNSQPAFALANAGSWSFLFCEGCSTLQQGLSCLSGYQGGLLDSWTVPRNDYFDQVKDNILAAARANGYLQGINVMCVGHSLGGAVAELVAGQIRDTNRQANVAYCTFGAPKPTSWPVLEPTNRCVAARWFGPDDPVPLLSPTSADNLTMLVAFSVRENQRFSNFAQPFGGLSIGADGSIVQGTYPETARVDSITNIAAWLYSLDTQAGIAHALPTYIARLTATVTATAAAAANPRPTDHTNDGGGSSHRDLTDAQRGAKKALQEQEANKNKVPLSIPQAFKVAVIKQGGIFQVIWQDSTVAVASRKRTAHSTARKLNSFLASCLRQGVVDKTGMEVAMQAFFRAAEDDTSGIAPQLTDTLRVNLP